MSYNDIYNKNLSAKKRNDNDPLNGIYLGIIRSTYDESRSGRMDVEIPSLTQDPTKNITYPCVFTSPFAGGTNPADIGKDIKKYAETQKSYGLWMVPPDEGNLVLVAFADGNSKFGYIVSCLYPDRFTHMVPGMPAGKSYGDPSMLLPVAEKNKRDEKPTHNDALRPLHVDIAEGIVKQGLANDPLRGAGRSGSRRESPSEVFGILTPGPKDPNDPKNRLGGHQLIMDDSLESRLVRLRTAGGNQLLMDDTTGVVYIINKKGSAWFELSTNGDIYMHSEGTIAMRAKGNFDLRADKDINLEAGQNINMKAAADNARGEYVGVNVPGIVAPPLGTGGSIRMDAAADFSAYAGLNAQVTAAGGDIDLSSAGKLAAQTGILGMHFTSMGDITSTSTKLFQVVSTGVSVSSGAVASISAPIVNINSGPPVIVPALPAITAPQLGTTEQKDSPANAPEFDREAAMRGESGATTAGKRTGNQDKIATIVSRLVTSEPFNGHAKYDPIKAADAQNIKADQSIIDALPAGAVDTSGKPADVNVPGTFMQGVGYTDANGNTLSDVTATTAGDNAGFGSVGELNSTIDSLTTGALADSVGGISSTLSSNISGSSSGLQDGIANFNEVANLAADAYYALQNIDLIALEAAKGLIKAQLAAIPPIRFPIVTALQQKIVGVMKKLSELEAQLKQFAVDALGNVQELMKGAIGKMQDTIKGVIDSVGNGVDMVKELASKGIQTIKDGASAIFVDSEGNKLIDFSNGIGPIGVSLGLASSLAATFSRIKNIVNTPLTENEIMAVSDFANDIGVENFEKSNVLTALNNLAQIDPVADPAKYAVAKAQIPRLMQGWVLASNSAEGDSVPQDYMVSKRKYQASLFQTPAGVDIDPGDVPVGTLSFAEIADLIDNRRAEFLRIKKSTS